MDWLWWGSVLIAGAVLGVVLNRCVIVPLRRPVQRLIAWLALDFRRGRAAHRYYAEQERAYAEQERAREVALRRDRLPIYQKQCLNFTCPRPHYEWIDYGRAAEGWECDTQGFATITRLHVEDVPGARTS